MCTDWCFSLIGFYIVLYIFRFDYGVVQNGNNTKHEPSVFTKHFQHLAKYYFTNKCWDPKANQLHTGMRVVLIVSSKSLQGSE